MPIRNSYQRWHLMFRKYKYAEQNLLVLTDDLELSLSLHGVALTK